MEAGESKVQRESVQHEMDETEEGNGKILIKKKITNKQKPYVYFVPNLKHRIYIIYQLTIYSF